MNPVGHFFRRIFGWRPLVFWLAFAVPAQSAESLDWRQREGRVTAEIEGWTLPKLLENIAAATGWQIYVEPDTKVRISTKFTDRPPGDALRLLLGDLSFALLPQTNAPARLFVFRTSLHEATQLVRAPEKGGPPKGPKPIANEVIVKLKPGAKIDELAKKLGAKVVGRVDGLNAYRLRFDDADAASAAREQLKGNADVESVDYNFDVPHPPEAESVTYSSVPPLNLRPKLGGDGSHLIVGLIDTPIQPKGSGIEDFVLPSLSVAGDGKSNDAMPTHGTSMSETVLRGLSMAFGGSDATSVRILPVDVYGNNPTTTTFDVANGIYQAINNGATIINLSLGSEGDSSLLRQVIQSGHDQGVLFFAAAGNEHVTTPTYPAAYPEVIAVTAGDRKGNVATYANYGDFVDVIAPGSALVTFQGQAYIVMGTSASTAYAAGLAAGEADKTKKTLAQVAADILGSLSIKSKP